jgi:hypothetical protein
LTYPLASSDITSYYALGAGFNPNPYADPRAIFANLFGSSVPYVAQLASKGGETAHLVRTALTGTVEMVSAILSIDIAFNPSLE